MTGSGQANPWKGYIVLSLVWLAVTGGVWVLARRPAPEAIQVLPAPTAAPMATPSPMRNATPMLPGLTPGPLRVDVAGAVQVPGVYALPPGSIVADAIAAAGGAAPGAALDRLNKASPLADGIQVYVPQATETIIPTPIVPPMSPGTASRLPASGPSSDALGEAPGGPVARTPIDINRATAAELETLPGIGPELAKRIIAARPYASVDDLDRVSGIGTARLEQIRPYVSVP